ncbi:choice-of-anchor W domain-containing protein [Paracraurococcus ruber]|nr:choice-of-anchor W domain-containing protein [Paracraurococcus ruber]
MTRLLAALAGAVLAAGAAQAAPVTTLLANYDTTFSTLCNGVACEQAVAEARNGDNGRTAAQAEWNIGPNTSAPTATVNISGLTGGGLWNGTALPFRLAYDGSDLRFGIDRGSGFQDVTYTVSLAATQTLFIRAVARSGGADTTIAGLALSGNALPTLAGDSGGDYLRVSNFTWSSAWNLTGTIAMTGGPGAGAVPSVQFKLTNLAVPPPVPEPAGIALLGLGLAALGVARRGSAASARAG